MNAYYEIVNNIYQSYDDKNIMIIFSTLTK